MTYFNEFDQGPAQWLQNAFPDASVDDRSIIDVQPDDLVGFHRVHFFAGIGGWELALRLAGWPDDLPVWTGSCPCQPFSVAGKGAGTDDPRHLWPEMRRLIDVCQPPAIFGEQTSSLDGRAWLAGVRADLEAMEYAVGAADLCAAGVGAPHARQRLYWGAVRVRNTDGQGSQRRRPGVPAQPGHGGGSVATCAPGGKDPSSLDPLPVLQRRELLVQPPRDAHGGLPLPALGRVEGEPIQHACERVGHWSDYDVLPYRGTARRVEPGAQPLDDGVSARVVKIRAYGNAIVPSLAAVFIKAFTEAAGIR